MSSISKKNIDSSLKFVYSDNNSLSVIFHDNDLLMGVVGEFNKNLKELEKITQSSLYSRGNSILIKSNPHKNEIIKNAIQFLAKQFINNGAIENKDIVSSIDDFMINEKVKNNNITDIIKTPKKSIIPRSEKQKGYVRALRQSDIIISAGPAEIIISLSLKALTYSFCFSDLGIIDFLGVLIISVTLLFFTFSLIINLSTEETISLFSILPLIIN